MKKPLKKIYIEITNACNLTCSFCSEINREKKFMSIEQFEHIANSIKPYCDYVYLHVKGEPLLHPKLDEILDICQKYQLKANITTNGTLLLKNIDMLKNKESLRQVNISLHAETGDKEKYFDQCITASKILAQNDKYVSLRLWNGEQGQKDRARLHEIFPENYIKGNRETLDKNIFLSIDSFWKWPDLNDDIVALNGTCQGLKSQIGILVCGTVVPCCLDGEKQSPIGNIFTDDFQKLWQDKIQCLRNKMINNVLPLELCRKCTYREKFSHKS